MQYDPDDQGKSGSTPPEEKPVTQSYSEIAKQMEIAEDVMREFKDLLRKLAE